MIKKIKSLVWYACVPLVTVLFAWINLSTKVPLKTLFWLQPLFILINIILIAVFGYLARKTIRKSFSKVPRWAWVGLLLILLFGLGLRLAVPPKLHRIYYDEDIYINVAHNIANDGRACLCDYGTPRECYNCIDNKQPMGMQTLNALFFKLGLAGSEQSVFILNMIIASLGSVFIFALGYKLTEEPVIGLLSGLFLMLTPDHVLWSATASQDAFFPTFMLAAATLFVLMGKTRNIKLWLLGFLVAAYTCQIRTEGILILPVLGFFLVINSPKPWKLLKRKELILGLLMLFILILPTCIHLMANRSDSWGAPQGRKFGMEYLPKNGLENILYYFQVERFPIVFTFFALAGLLYGFWKYLKPSLALLAWFGGFFLLYGFFYAGSVNFGMDVRFMLTIIPAFLIFAGFGSFALWELFKKAIQNSTVLKQGLGGLLILGLIAGVTTSHYSQISSFGEKAGDAMRVHEFAKEFAANSSEDCLFISQVSSMFLNFNRPSIQTHQFLWGNETQNILDSYDCIYFYWGYWCASSEPHRREQCSPLLNKYNWDYIAQAQEYDKLFVFYRLVKGQ